MAAPESLPEYIEERIFKAKRLNAERIGRNSGGRITASYIRELVSGRAQHPSVEVLLALAEGSDTDPLEILRVAAHLPRDKAWTVEAALQTMGKIARSAELTEIVRLLEDKDPEELRIVLKTLKGRRPKQR
jgi:transcriptional regulator with XRE-family HTH domain